MKNSYYLFFVLFFVIVPRITNSQTLQENLYVTNGSVRATVISGNTLYIGGDFTQVGPSTGYGAAIDTSTGNYDAAMPKVNGIINAVVPDGLGGWFIGGAFTYVGAVARNKIAHIKADKTVDMSWNPNATKTTLPQTPVVYALAVSGSTVYVGGQFTNIGGLARNNIAALDFTTGAATTWNPNASFPTTAIVYALAVSGSTVYAGGTFTKIGTTVRNNIAAIGTSGTGTLTSWNPSAGGRVNAIAVSGSTVYAGGLFLTIGGQTRNRIAALNITTGTATTWDPNANSTVYALAISGSTVYASGNFSSIGGQARNYIAALDSTTPGLATSWNPAPNATGYVNVLALSGSAVYAGGVFTTIGGQTRNRIAALDTTTGLATTWDPNANNEVKAIAVSGSIAYAGGNFTSIGGQTRNKIAALDITTGLATTWNPDANSTVFALTISGSIVYAGGNFTSIGGQTRNKIAALDITSGTSTSWNPDAGGTVYTLVVSGSTVFAGGLFGSIGGQTRNNLAALDITTGFATTWDPTANNTVFALTVSGSTVYVGGDYTSIGGQVRNYIAALDSTTPGLATSWDPNASGQVRALAFSGSAVYAGGNFTSIGGQARNYIAALDITTGLATTWNSSNANNIVYDIAVSGSTVYAGGAFTTIGGQTRNKIAALDITTGLATTWNPNASGVVNTISLDFTNGRIYAGGDFTTVMNSSYSYLAGLTNPDDPLPVELTSFTANILSNGIELKWQTATEVNNYGFEIERRPIPSPSQKEGDNNSPRKLSGGKEGDFAKVGFVNGSGNSSSPKQYSFIDNPRLTGVYNYRLKQIDNNGEFKYSSIVEISAGSIPTRFELAQNYPNPFNPATTISYSIPTNSFVTLKVFNILGQEVALLVNETLTAGKYTATFNAGNIASGVYLYHIEATPMRDGATALTGSFHTVKKMLLIR